MFRSLLHHYNQAKGGDGICDEAREPPYTVDWLHYDAEMPTTLGGSENWRLYILCHTHPPSQPPPPPPFVKTTPLPKMSQINLPPHPLPSPPTPQKNWPKSSNPPPPPPPKENMTPFYFPTSHSSFLWFLQSLLSGTNS